MKLLLNFYSSVNSSMLHSAQMFSHFAFFFLFIFTFQYILGFDLYVSCEQYLRIRHQHQEGKDSTHCRFTLKKRINQNHRVYKMFYIIKSVLIC
jgi:hypothetical protein